VTARRTVTALLALVAAVGLLGSPIGPTAPEAVRAARPDLTITSHATYDVQPDEQRIHVTVDLTLTNHLKDTKTRRYYFDEAFLDVMPRSSGFKLTRKGSSPTVKVAEKDDEFTRLRLAYPRLYSGKTAKYRLTFDLKDPGGAPTRDLRVGDSLVSFPVWAFATDSTPGSSVSVEFPAGYEVEVEAGAIKDPTTDADGRTVFDTGKLDKPLTFFAYLVGSRPGAYREETVATTVLGAPASLVVRSWPDDEPWAERVGGLLLGALPALGERIGLPWPYDEPLTVEEAVSRSTEGYAGLFDPRRGLVEIAYYADDFVVLHEAAHGWFNGSLLADRWANEAFASYYAAEVAETLDVDARGDELTDELRASRIPLNAWGPVGEESAPQEDYAYAASLALARAIATRAGEDGLQAVWYDAADGVGAYQPMDGGVERVEGPPDWRGLLDLLEARTAAGYSDLWRTWVARPDDALLLDARASARLHYAAVTEQAADWRLPRPIRDALRAWQFDDAATLLADASAVLDARADVDAAAEASGLIAPAGLRLAFEDDDGFEDAEAEAAAELATIEQYATAVALRPAATNPFIELGLYGETPEVSLDAARDALARGDLEGSVTASIDAGSAWSEAEAVGQGRAFSIVLLVLAAVLFATMVVLTIRRRRRRRQRVRMARRIAAD
jgi:hypothetical protein